ncbi:MAG: HipA domain-containing protein [Lachnospiraceae bacterium]|nr:HipA domain-containing protein [Lachnospiraceae bacterium]
MNKDNIVLRFEISRSVLGVNYNIVGDVMGVLPKDLVDISEWVKSRYILSHRVDVLALFSQLGAVNIEDYISITNCISLNDTFWIKPADSNKNWNFVSPYRNSLNKTISEFSFTGKVNGKYISGSPDFSTGGNYPKCWKRVNNDIYLYKAGTNGFYNVGLEPFSEIFAYQLAKYLGFDCVEYKYKYYKNTDACVCKNMCNETIGLISFKDLIKDSVTDYNKVFNYIVNSSNSKMEMKKFIDMLLLDTLVCNVDRHFGNISYYIDNDTQQILGISSIYDNNLSCIPYYVEDEDLIYCINDIRAKDGSTFNELYNLIKCSYTKSLLQKARNFKFSKIGVSKADKRVPILNKMLDYRISECLSR